MDKIEDIIKALTLQKLKFDLNNLSNIVDKWGYLRQIYLECMPYIVSAHKKDLMVDPYFVDWGSYLNKAEFAVWEEIRCQCLTLYPQVPLFNYFIDFANPCLKIGVEVDGRAWHDPVKDKKRDEFFFEYGWFIFRIPASEIYTNIPNPFFEENFDDEMKVQEHLVEDWILNTSDGVLYAIKKLFFYKNHIRNDEAYLCYESLSRHTLIEKLKNCDFSKLDKRT